MVSTVGCQILCWAFRACGCLLSIFGFEKKVQKHKNRIGKIYTFFVTDRSDIYLAWGPVYLSLIE